MNIDSDAAINILRSSIDAIVVVDDSGVIVLANEVAEKLFGYEQGELTGQKVEILMPAGFRPKHEAQRTRFGESPRARPLVSGLSLKGQRKNGEIFDAEIALAPVSSSDGRYVSSTIRDISSDDTSEAYFRNVLESAPDAMVIIDHLGKITVVNGQTEKMFGYKRSELLGQEVEMLLPEDIRDRHISHRAAYSANPQLREMGSGFELHGRRSDGTEFPVEISLSPFVSASGAFISSVIRDVTSRKEMEQALIDARQEAERANKANTAFLAAASHDLRQPVQALALLNGALRRTLKDELSLEMVESQQHSLDAMTNLLNSLLDISRLDAGKVEPELEDFRVQRLVDRLHAESARQARQKDLYFVADTCERVIVRSDPNLLGEIIQNFVSNAIRYTDKGEVRLTCREDDGDIWIEVVDTGIGIAPDQLEEIFNEFHQVQSPGKDKEGFGLGLAIVKRMADLLDHEIAVSSDLGRGSTFSIRLPIVGKRDLRGNQAEDAVEDEAPMLAGSIILIEDDVKVANAWGLLLRAEGFDVATAASAKETEAVVGGLTSPPDLIISDFHLLDDSTGVEAVSIVRDAFKRDIPAFIVTGDTSKMVQEARETPNCIIMNKPVNTDELLKNAEMAIETGVVPGD
jgi:PAS domain S-box-containing protein